VKRLQSYEPSDAFDVVRQLAEATGRRRFLQWAGVTVAVATVGCDDDGGDITEPGGGTGSGNDGAREVSLGSGDNAVLNYAYALEQLEAAFYTIVVGGPYTDATPEEIAILTDIRDHEVIHRDFLAGVLAGNAIARLSFTFSGLDFTSRDAVLEAARSFEDLGVAAYNGVAARIVDPTSLLLAGKIVSVEARHAAAIRDMLEPLSGAFAGNDVVDPQGLDRSLTPAQVLQQADPYITTTINASGLA
jgi:hypothetical protein